MAAPTIGRRARWAPGPSARIDWSHPLAQQCVFYTLPAYALDLTALPVVVTGGVLRNTASPWGIAASGWVSGSIYETVGITSFPIVGDVAKSAMTIVFSGITAASGSSFGSTLFSERGTAGNAIAKVCYEGVTAGKLTAVWRDDAGTLIFSAGATSVNDGRAHVVSLVRTSATTFEMWLDGKLDLSVTSGAMTTTFTQGTLEHRIGGDAGDTSDPAVQAAISAVILHRNRALTSNAVGQLHADPFCMLR